MYCHPTGSEIALKTLAQNINKQDQAKNIDIKDYMPEVAAVIFDNL